MPSLNRLATYSHSRRNSNSFIVVPHRKPGLLSVQPASKSKPRRSSCEASTSQTTLRRSDSPKRKRLKGTAKKIPTHPEEPETKSIIAKRPQAHELSDRHTSKTGTRRHSSNLVPLLRSPQRTPGPCSISRPLRSSKSQQFPSAAIARLSN